MDTFFLYIGKSAISSLLQLVSSREISHSSADLTQCFNLVTRKVHFSSLSQSFCNPEHPPVSASQTKNYSSMKSGGSPVPWRWLCGSSGVPKAAVLTAHSQHCCKCWAKHSGGRNWLQRTEGTGKGWQRRMAPPLCPLIICLAHLIPSGSSLKADPASVSETGLLYSSQGRRTEAKPSPCSQWEHSICVSVSVPHPVSKGS